MAKKHLIGTIGDERDTAACGLWNPSEVTGNLDDVTCGVCRRSRSFYIAKLKPESRSPVMVEYRGKARACSPS